MPEINPVVVFGSIIIGIGGLLFLIGLISALGGSEPNTFLIAGGVIGMIIGGIICKKGTE